MIEDATQTASGLYYTILEEGQGDTPYPGQKVKVHYTGYFIDGKQFDSSIGKKSYRIYAWCKTNYSRLG